MSIQFKRDFYAHFRDAKMRSRGRLPHVEADEALYSITYRLADAIPAYRVDALRRERESLLAQLARDNASAIERSAALELIERQYDRILDEGHGSCVLRRDDAAAIVAENLRFHAGKRYELDRWSIMPNHVHVSMLLHRGEDLDDVLHSWKSYTSNEINKVLRRKGRLWEPEYFDRLIRDESDLIRTNQYIYENPEQAGLRNWKWRG